MHHRNLAVLTQMGVGVDVIRFAVGGPAGVPDSHTALQRSAPVHKGTEHLKSPFGLFHLQAPVF